MLANTKAKSERRRRWTRRVVANVTGALVLLSASASLSGCIHRTDAQKLADSGALAANTLANYYDTLGQQVDDIYEMESFSNALRGIPRDRDYEQELQETREALQRRSRLARQLAASYQSLRDLSSYDASGEISNSFGNLSQALIGIPPLKGIGKSTSSAPVDPQKLLSKGASLLAGWKQSRDIQKAVRAMTDTLEGLSTLFTHELPACQSISEEYVEKAGVIANELAKKNLVNAWPLLEHDLQVFGLKPANPNVPPADPAVIKALAQVVQARSFRLQGLSDQAGQNLMDALNHQLTSQHQFLAKQGISTADAQTALETASSLLNEIAKQRSATKP
jgi:hypothetical protein